MRMAMSQMSNTKEMLFHMFHKICHLDHNSHQTTDLCNQQLCQFFENQFTQYLLHMPLLLDHLLLFHLGIYNLNLCQLKPCQ